MDWSAVITTLGSTTIVVAALGFVARNIIDHLFKRDLENYKAALNKSAIEEKALFENDLKKRTDAILLHQKNAFDQQMETFRSTLASRTAKADRVREEVVRWANPILSAIGDLQGRLDNILNHEGYLMLSADAKPMPGWSAQYHYFLPSTIYYFCQYFCWIRLLEERLSFEMFERHDEKDRLFDCVRRVGSALSRFPLDILPNMLGEADDRQVFALEQRTLGEIMTIKVDGERCCLSYSEFVDKWHDVQFKNKLIPMIDFLEALAPSQARRWHRLGLLSVNLNSLREECLVLLNLDL